jgi:hypothetical protein
MRFNPLPPLAGMAWLVLAGASAWGGTAELKTERFRLRFGQDGKPASPRALPGDEELLVTRNAGPGFYLSAADFKEKGPSGAPVRFDRCDALQLAGPWKDRNIVFTGVRWVKD